MSLASLSVHPSTPATTMKEAVESRLAEWKRSFLELPVCEEWLLREACSQTIRLEATEGHETMLISRFMTRASLAWDQGRELAVEELGDKLPRKPGPVSARLRSSRHGCLWMAGRWKALSVEIEANGDWTEDQRDMALDLLGVAPEFRDGTTRLDPPAPADPLAARRLVIASEVALLLSLAKGPLQGIDDEERATAEEGVGVESDPGVKAHRRHLAACRRRIDFCLLQLKPFRKPVEADEPPALILPAPRPAFEPPPPPDPDPEPDDEPEPQVDRVGSAIANYLARTQGDARPVSIEAAAPIFTGNRQSRRAQEARYRKGG
jgi:hypothetical protein